LLQAVYLFKIVNIAGVPILLSFILVLLRKNTFYAHKP
jgi:hypothetical protein